MLTLIFDTAASIGILAIAKGNSFLFSEVLGKNEPISKVFFPTLNRGLKQSGLNIEEIGLIACGTGPGSFTGMRIGSAAAKTISYTLKTPLVDLCSLLSFIPEKDGPFASMIDGRSGGIYTLFGERRGDRITYCNKEMLVPNERLSSLELQYIVTPDREKINAKLNLYYQDFKGILEHVQPNAKNLLCKALKFFDAGHFTTNGNLPLRYLRKTEAERSQNSST